VGVAEGFKIICIMGKMKKFKKYGRVWWLMAKNAAIVMFATRYGAVLFLAGKILRFGFFVYFLSVVVGGVDNLAGYDFNAVIFFFLTFSLVDTLSQCLFREVYRFRSHVVNGTLDFILLKPVNPLFRSLMGGPDILDFITLVPLLGALFWFMIRMQLGLAGVGLYLLFVINGMALATALHVLVLGLGVITTEVDHAMMIYRDVTGMGRMPVDVYKYPVNVILTWFLPVAAMMSFPVKVALGLLSWWGGLAAIVAGVGLLLLALEFWGYAIKQYSSASS